MRIGLLDLPSLEGLHFVLTSRDWGDGTVYRIGDLSIDGRILITWGDEGDDSRTYYPVEQFIEYINDESWVIIDLPNIDFDNLDIE